MSHMGVARDLKAGCVQRNIPYKWNFPNTNAFKVDNTSLPIDVIVEEPKMAPSYKALDVNILQFSQYLFFRIKVLLFYNNLADCCCSRYQVNRLWIEKGWLDKLYFEPANNEPCLETNSVNDTQSSITFRWNAAQNVTSYDLTVVNLANNTDNTYNATSNEKNLTLEHDEPYSWKVISNGESGTQPVESDT